jgi:16S rRNA (cytidine1402-2'-O)-methyltransferase
MADKRKEKERGLGSGGLYVVATPVGNMEDITLRALRTLKEVDLIAAEGVEHTRRLCRRFDIRTRLTSYNQNNSLKRGPELLERLRRGESLALVTNAGTPGISDPGSALVRSALDEGFRVVPVPGPCAAVTALSCSGLRSDGFLFAGFLSNRAGRRRKEIGLLSSEPRTLVFYEAPHRIRAMLADLRDALGDRRAVAARELTKIHEEFLQGTPGEILGMLEGERTRGEFTVMVEGAPQRPVTPGPDAAARAGELLTNKDMTLGDAARELAREQGIGYRRAYRICLSIQSGGPGGRGRDR